MVRHCFNGISFIELLSVITILGMLGAGFQTWHQLTEKTLLNNEVAKIESFLRSGLMLAANTKSDVRICPLSGKQCLNQVYRVDWNKPIGLFIGKELKEVLTATSKPFVRTGPKITNFILKGVSGTQSGTSLRVCRAKQWSSTLNQIAHNIDASSSLHQAVVLAPFGRITIERNVAEVLTPTNNCIKQ